MKKHFPGIILLLMISIAGYSIQYKASTRLNIRQSPSSNGEKLATVDAGFIFEVEDYDAYDGWTEVQYENQRAFVSSKYLVLDNSASVSVSDGDAAKNRKIAIVSMAALIAIILFFILRSKPTIEVPPKPTPRPVLMSDPTAIQLEVMMKKKSMLAGILLTFLFGPFGLFYATTTGGLIMLFGPICVMILLAMAGLTGLLIGSFFFIVIFGWSICIIWTIIGVDGYNTRLAAKARSRLMNAKETGSSNIDGEIRKEEV